MASRLVSGPCMKTMMNYECKRSAESLLIQHGALGGGVGRKGEQVAALVDDRLVAFGCGEARTSRIQLSSRRVYRRHLRTSGLSCVFGDAKMSRSPRFC